VQPGLPRIHQATRKGLAMANSPQTLSPETLQRGQLGLFGVIMPGLAQVAPAFNLFFTTGVMVALAGASAPLIFLISMVGMGATASSLAQFAGVYPWKPTRCRPGDRGAGKGRRPVRSGGDRAPGLGTRFGQAGQSFSGCMVRILVPVKISSLMM